MKKIKFLKTKFCTITTFVLGAFGSLILAACEPINTIPTTPNSSIEPDLSFSVEKNPPNKVEVEIDAKSELEEEIDAKISNDQKALATKLLSEPGFLTYLNKFIHGREVSLETNVDFIANLYASHAKDVAHLDVTKLNDHLNQEQEKIKKIWTTDGLTTPAINYWHLNLRSALHDLVNRNDWFKKYFISDNNHQSQIVVLLDDALKTVGINDDEKKVIDDFLTEFNKLSAYFKKLYNSFFDLNSNTSVLGIVSELIAIIDNMDATISDTQDLGTVLKAVATLNYVVKVGKKFNNILPKQKENYDATKPFSSIYDVLAENSFEETPWLIVLKELFPLINPLNNVPNFVSTFIALAKYNFTTNELKVKMSKILKINTNERGQGYLYDAVVNKLYQIISWFVIHSDNSLRLRLNQLIDLAEKSLNLSQDSEVIKSIANLSKNYANN